MYAEVIKFKVKSGSEDEAKAMASEILENLKGSKGFVSAVIYHDEEKNEWGRTTVWETREDSAAFRDSREPERQKYIMERVDGPIEVKRCDVIGYVTVD